MSNVSNRHSVIPFIAGKSAALTDQRLAKVGYKSTKKNPAKYRSVCASVPVIDSGVIALMVDDLMPHIRTMIETAQDGILRSLYESSKGQLTSVSDDELSVPACIAYMNAEASGDRLNAETIGAWFDSAVTDNLTVILCEKLGIEELNETTQPTIDKHVKVYRDILCLVTGKSVMTPVQLNACEKVLEIASQDEPMYSRLVAKVKSLQPKHAEFEMLL